MSETTTISSGDGSFNQTNCVECGLREDEVADMEKCNICGKLACCNMNLLPDCLARHQKYCKKQHS